VRRLQVLYVGLHLAALAFDFRSASFVPTDAYTLAGVAFASTLAYFGVWLKAMRVAWNKAPSRAEMPDNWFFSFA